MPTPLIISLLALLIIAGLGWYAFSLWRKVWQRQAAARASEQQRNRDLAEDIRFLANSLLSGQLPLIEGSIRIKVLMDNYSAGLLPDHDHAVFSLIYDETVHIPTHKAWKALPASERKAHEKHMQRLEQEHADRVREAAQRISESFGLQSNR